MDVTLSPSEAAFRDEARLALAAGEPGFDRLLTLAQAAPAGQVLAGILLEEAGAAGAGLATAARVAATLWRGTDEPAALALQGASGGWTPETAPLRAGPHGYSGQPVAVLGFAGAQQMIVAFLSGDGRPGAGLVQSTHPAISAVPVTGLDRDPQHRLEIDKLPTRDVTLLPHTPELLYDLTAICAAALMIGAARQAMTLAIEHARQRQLFGRTLDAFQITRHLAADMLIGLEATTLLTREAFWVAAQTGCPGALSAQAKLMANKMTVDICRTAQQMMGGKGFVQGNQVHGLYRRVLGASLVFGTTSDHALRLADAVTRSALQPRMTAFTPSPHPKEEVCP